MATEFTPTPEQPPPKLRWYQYRLRSLLLLMLVATIPLGWVAVKMKAAREQHAAVEAIVKLGGRVVYDYQFDPSNTTGKPPGPAWLRGLLGDDLLATVKEVDLHKAEIVGADLKCLTAFPQLEGLPLSDCYNLGDDGLKHLKPLTKLRTLILSLTGVSDAGLKHLRGLTQLQRLDLDYTKVTDAGIENLKGLTELGIIHLDGTKVSDAGERELQKALPKIHILQFAGPPYATRNVIPRMKDQNCLTIRGGIPLHGEVRAAGSKNAALTDDGRRHPGR